MAKILTVSRKSHHPIETLKQAEGHGSRSKNLKAHLTPSRLLLVTVQLDFLILLPS